MEEWPVRKRVRLEGYDYSNAGYYFITICIQNRHELLGKIVGDAPLRVPRCVLSEYGVFVDAQIQKIGTIYPHVLVDNYIIMPNHLHMIIAVMESGTRRGASPTKAIIPQAVQSLKSMATKQFGFNMWQRSYHDHIIRNESEYKMIWHYIDQNPATWEDDRFFCSAQET